MVTKIDKRYVRTSEKLKTLRRESRAIRKKLIEAIICNEKDVLAPSEIKDIEKALAHFLKVQKRLSQAFFQNSGAFAQVLWKAGSQPIDDLLD